MAVLINTRHAGLVSRLHKGLYEAAGRLGVGEVNIAVVPGPTATHGLATKMAPRANKVGIAIALVSAAGVVEYCGTIPSVPRVWLDDGNRACSLVEHQFSDVQFSSTS